MAALPTAVAHAHIGKMSAAIFKAYEAREEDGRRPHLGASIIGRECQRQTWYTFRWAKNLPHEGRILRLFDTGHKAEPRFIADLRATGVEVYDVDESGKQFRISDHGGHFGGSTDGVGKGVIYAPKTWAVLEFKTHGSKSFAKLKNHGVKSAKLEHYVQCQVYMLKLNLERALYLAVNKDTDELHDEWITIDGAFAQSQADLALSIITAGSPPAGISAEKGDFRCKYCDYADLCFGDQVPLPSCRSCAHATPELTPGQDGASDGSNGGRWSCSKWSVDIPDVAAQRIGCDGHRFIPIFLAATSEPVEYRNDDVVYRSRKSGKLFANGKGPAAFSSIEIHAMGDGAKCELGQAAEVKSMFPTARIVG